MTIHNIASENLWPDLEELSGHSDIPPKEILQQQAKFFGQRTNNLLEAVVRSSVMDEQTGKLYHNFMIRAPLLPNVQTKLFWVGHNLNLYPVDVMLNNTQYAECFNSTEFIEALRNLFHEKSILSQVSNLLAQSKAAGYIDDSDDDA